MLTHRERNTERGGKEMKYRSLTVCAIIFLVALITMTSAHATEVIYGASITGEDQELKSALWFPADIRVFTPGNVPLAFAGSDTPVAAVAFKGLPLEVSIGVVGIDNLLGVDLTFANAELFDQPSSLPEGKWLPMVPDGGRKFTFSGNTSQLAWGKNMFLFRVRHKDDKGIVRFLFFKFTILKDGNVQTAYVVNVQEAPPGYETMNREELYLYLRGFLPAWATPADQSLADKLRIARENVSAVQVSPVADTIPVVIKTDRGFESKETVNGSEALYRFTIVGGFAAMTDPLGRTTRVPLNSGSLTVLVPIGSELVFRPEGSTQWGNYRKVTSAQVQPVDLSKGGN